MGYTRGAKHPNPSGEVKRRRMDQLAAEMRARNARVVKIRQTLRARRCDQPASAAVDGMEGK